MHIHLHPLAAAILAVSLPTLATWPAASIAATVGPIHIDDAQGATSMVLEPGTTVTSNALDAITVIHQGNSVLADDITVSGTGSAGGVHAVGGGAVGLTSSSVQTHDGVALLASGLNSKIQASDTHITSATTAIHATGGSAILLVGGSVVGTGTGSPGAAASAISALIALKSLDITSVDGLAVKGESGSRILLGNVVLSSTDGEGKKTAAKVSVDGSYLDMNDSHLTAGMEAGEAHAADLRIDGGSTASIKGGSIDGTIDVWNGSTLTMHSTAVAATHDAN